MTIHFIEQLEQDNEKIVFSLYDQVSNPFSIGDEVKLNVSDLTPSDLANKPTKLIDSLTATEKDLKRLRFKNFVVKDINKWVNLHPVKDNTIEIEVYGTLEL